MCPLTFNLGWPLIPSVPRIDAASCSYDEATRVDLYAWLLTCKNNLKNLTWHLHGFRCVWLVSLWRIWPIFEVIFIVILMLKNTCIKTFHYCCSIITIIPAIKWASNVVIHWESRFQKRFNGAETTMCSMKLDHKTLRTKFNNTALFFLSFLNCTAIQYSAVQYSIDTFLSPNAVLCSPI